jgi:Domain of unknown function (DUF4352)
MPQRHEAETPRRCGRCAAAVGANDEVCATCGARVSRGGRSVLAVAVAALLLLLAAVGALTALTLGGERELRDVAAPVAAVEEGTTSPFATGVEELAVGETAEAAGARVTLEGVRALPVTDADQPRKRGHAFLAGTVTFENVTGEPVAVSDLLEFALVDETGRVAVRTFHGDQSPLDEGGEVAPGEKAGGEIVYEIPPGARGLRLGYDPAGGGSYAWPLGDAAKFFGPAASAVPRKGQDRTEAGVVLAVKNYYRAVDREDWAYTYDHLASGTRSAFTEAEWELKNQWFADNFPVRLAALEVETRMLTPSALVAEVTVNRTFADGAFAPRDTTFVYENGSWKHLFSHEEVSLFLPGVPFEQFVAAQQAAGVTPAAQEAAVKEAVRGHYGAIGRGDFAAAYSYFGPTHRKPEGRRAWISSEKTYGITASSINYLDVTYADGITAAATVDVTFQDDTGAPRILVTWILTKQNGAWKLDRRTSAERL